MPNTTNIWPRKRSNLLMGVSVGVVSALATPPVRDQIHKTLSIEEKDQAMFDVLMVSAATILGLCSLYQMGRFDAANFILSPPEHGSTSWFVTEGGTRKNPKWAWTVSVTDPREVTRLV